MTGSAGRRRLLLTALSTLVLGTALAGCGGSDPNTIVLYNGQHPQLTSELVQAFTRQTGFHVNVRTGDGIVLADQILQEGSSSPADVFLTENSPELMNLETHGLLAELPATILDQIPARESSPAGKWVGIALRVSALAYDPARISPSQLPSSILQLAQPQWKGKIAVAPTDSDFPPLVGAVVATNGTSAAEQWLAGLKRNAQIYQDDEAVVAAVNRGDVAAGIINQYYWYRLRLEVGNGGIHSRLYYFPHHDPGSVQNVSGAAILASSQRRRAAQAFVNFLVSPTAQRIVATSYDYEYPARPGIPPHADLPSLRSISPDTLSPSALGTDQTAVRLIQEAGLT
jgi:iron(III) transport system substrate-binding protein